MELLETELTGSSDLKILKDPITFVSEVKAKMSTEQEALAIQCFKVRADLLIGLGMAERAAAKEQAAAAILAPDDPELKDKRPMSSDPQKIADPRVPCIVLIGGIGAGKTTLLNHILKATHGKNIAVIQHASGEEDLLEVNDGGMPCTVRLDIINGLKRAFKRSKQIDEKLDAVLIETTGLADPEPAANTFLANDFVKRHVRLDGIITVANAEQSVQRHSEDFGNEAMKQIAFADYMLLNKCDLVEQETELVELEKRIRAINSRLPIKRTTRCELVTDFIWSMNDLVLDMQPHDIVEMGDAEGRHRHHEAMISSMGIDLPGEVVHEKVAGWVMRMLQEKGTDLLRSKGVFALQGTKQKFTFEASNTVVAGFTVGADPLEKRCKLVLVGKHLNQAELRSSFMQCMAENVGNSESHSHSKKASSAESGFQQSDADTFLCCEGFGNKFSASSFCEAIPTRAPSGLNDCIACPAA